MGAAASKRYFKRISINERINIIKKSPFTLYFEGDTLKEFAECFPYFIDESRQGGTVLLNKNEIYIVASGEMELRSSVPSRHSKVENVGYLCKKRPGDIISKIQEQKKAARKLSKRDKKLEYFVEEVKSTVTCSTSLLHSDSAKLEVFMSKHPNLKTLVSAILSSHIETYLAKIPFLKGVKESQLRLLAAMCQYEALEANEIVFEENSEGQKLYILLSGSATVLAPQWVGNATAMQQSLEWGDDKGNDQSNQVVVADLKSGDYFGETAMFVNVDRTSTVLTKEKCLFVTVDKITFENFLMVCPIRNSMTEVMKERMVSKLSSLGIPFFVGITSEKLQSLKNAVEIHEVNENDVIFREGDKGDRFYIIVHGKVQVETETNDDLVEEASTEDQVDSTSALSRRNSTRLGHLGPGNYFGEMALVSDAPRSATVIGACKTILLSVDKESFHGIFASNPQARAEFTLRLLRGSCQLNHFMEHTMGENVFRTFLKQSFAEENLDFWLSAKQFKDSFHESNDVSEKAKEIYRIYCDDGAENQINLPCSIRTGMKKSLDEEFDLTLFDEAMEEIYRLMNRDNFARFKKTPEFCEFFKCLGVLATD